MARKRFVQRLKDLFVDAGPEEAARPGSAERGIGSMEDFLRDVRARGFVPRGAVDVGANYGSWTMLARRINPGLRVLMIEPQAELQEGLGRLVRDTDNVELVGAGAGRQPGELIQTIWPDLAGSSFLPEADKDRIAKGEQRRTPIVTIDALLAERPDFHPDLVKLDIQGFELEALAGGGKLFGRTELFVLETSLYKFFPSQPLASEVVAFMAFREYELYDIVGHLRRPYDGALGQVDFVFGRKGGRLMSSSRW
jgi:FkbM family methyltransferase